MTRGRGANGARMPQAPNERASEARGDIPRVRPQGVMSIDDGISGTRLDRPALEGLRDLAAEGMFEVALVAAPGRVARRYAYSVAWGEALTSSARGVVAV